MLIFAGALNTGAVVSTLVIIWVLLEALPQASVRVHTRVIINPGLQPAEVLST